MRELDWKIHTLMGNDLTGWEWYVEDENSRYSHHICIREMQVGGEKVAVTKTVIPHYSTTWEGAGLVMEWMQENSIPYSITSFGKHGKRVDIVKVKTAMEYDTSTPLALCKAYISAMDSRQ